MKKSLFYIRVFGIFLSFILYNLFCITHVSAHILETSGNIGAVLHIDPEDDPIVGEQASFFFEFKDKTGKFKPTECNCTFSILENGKAIFTQQLFQDNADPSLTSASVFYTFPQKDVYQVKVIGKPMQDGQFDAFDLNYDIRVSRVGGGQASSAVQSTGVQGWIMTHIPHLAGMGILILFLVLTLIKPKTDSGKKI